MALNMSRVAKKNVGHVFNVTKNIPRGDDATPDLNL
jgi:hypothetical protein